MLNNGYAATSADFSDGQFQLVYIYAIVERFKDRNCLTLLDEPDAFLTFIMAVRIFRTGL